MNKHDYVQMVDRCTHLKTPEKSMINKLFSKFKELFSGKLGRVPGPPVRLKLKKTAMLFHSRAYTILKAFEELAKKEIQDLVDIGVLVKNVRTAYTSPSFFRKKKMEESVL